LLYQTTSLSPKLFLSEKYLAVIMVQFCAAIMRMPRKVAVTRTAQPLLLRAFSTPPGPSPVMVGNPEDFNRTPEEKRLENHSGAESIVRYSYFLPWFFYHG
jgi:hypothetical protein